MFVQVGVGRILLRRFLIVVVPAARALLARRGLDIRQNYVGLFIFFLHL